MDEREEDLKREREPCVRPTERIAVRDMGSYDRQRASKHCETGERGRRWELSKHAAEGRRFRQTYD